MNEDEVLVVFLPTFENITAALCFKTTSRLSVSLVRSCWISKRSLSLPLFSERCILPEAERCHPLKYEELAALALSWGI